MAHTKVTKTYSQNTGTANTFSYSGSFDVFKGTEVVALLDNVLLTYTASTINESASPREYTVDTSAKTIHIGGANLSSGTIIIRPQTDMGAPTPRADYTPGASITSADLNNNQLQLMRKAMEYDEQKLSSTGGTMTGDLTMGEDTNIIFEGATDDAYETTLTVTDPTADRTITLPNVSGTVVTTGDTGTVTSTMIDDLSLVDVDIAANAEIAVSKLADGAARQLLQTDSSGNTQFVVGSGMVMRDGKAILVPSSGNTTTFISGTPSTFDAPSSTGSGYVLLVVAANNTLAIRDNNNKETLNTVPQLTAGDIPIAMIRLAYGDNSAQRLIQYFTTAKSENSVSVGYNASTVYTETMSVIGDADRTTFKNKIANADIRFVLADNTADEKFEILTDDDSDGDEGDTALFTVNGLGATSIAGTVNLGSVVNAATDTDKFLVLDSGGNVDFRTGTAGSGSVDLDSEVLSVVGTSNEIETEPTHRSLLSVSQSKSVSTG